MKTTVKLFLAVLIALVCSIDRTCEGHGGGGGGGGHGGGGFGGGGSFGGGGMSHPSGMGYSRSPEMNTPHNFTPSHTEGNFNRPSYPDFSNHGGENAMHNNGYTHPSTIHPSTINNNTNINHFSNNHNGNNNAGHPNYGNWHPGNWNDHGHNDWHHDNWNHDWNHNWHYWPAAWWGAGFLAGEFDAFAPWAWGYWPYYNPYCVEPVVVGDTTIDYSQPIVLANTDDTPTTNTEGAMSWFASARKQFYNQDYEAALNADEQALAVTPSDSAMNEFRGLTLFALKKYKDAAGVVYAVLSVGPGWDWPTLIGLYPSGDVYTAQLRALEEYIRANPNDAAAHFLVAYHYLACGHNDAAATQLREVVKLNPQDTLSAQLLKGLTDKGTAPISAVAPAANLNQAPAKPMTAASLAGSWKSTRPDGSSIALTIATDGKYTWKYTQKDKTQEFSGPYTLADNLLILKKNETPMMVGQVTSQGENSFNFKLPGENPADSGLTFSK